MELSLYKDISIENDWYKAILIEFRERYKYASYSDWLHFEKLGLKVGMNLNRAFWNCPICKTTWYDCPHPLVSYWGLTATYPRWEDRPWREL